jgi:hypothetical protein
MTTGINPEFPLAQVCTEWLSLIKKAKEVKQKRFGQYADECYRFYNGDPTWMWDKLKIKQSGWLDDESQSLPSFRIQVNKVSDAVDLFGPAMIHQYPTVMVTATKPPVMPPEAVGINSQDPYAMEQYHAMVYQTQMQEASKSSCASVSQHYLNWVQVEGKKKDAARRSIVDAIVKGAGICYTDIHTPRGSSISYPRSRHLSIDQLIKDPDAKRQEDVQWIAIEWIEPVNLVEAKFDLPPGSLKGNMQSLKSQSTVAGERDAKTNKRESITYDLVKYYEVFSKNGFGQHLKNSKSIPDAVKQIIASWGDFTYGVFAPNTKFPLNLPTAMLMTQDNETLASAAQWPIPFWRDDGTGTDWPVSELYFKEDPNCVWPISIFKPVIGEIRFVNWCMSFLADKAANNAIDYIGVLKSAAEEIQEQVQSKTGPTRLLEVSSDNGGKISDYISFLQRPGSNVMELWNVVRQVMNEIDKRTGLTDLIYGQTGRQMRSATEADVLQENTTIRPDDMARKCEDWYSLMAMKEMQAAAWVLSPEDIAPAVGPIGASVFAQNMQTQDFDAIARDFSYRIAAGSARKPNKQQKLRTLNDFGQVFLPVAQQLVGMGITDPLNAYLTSFAESMDLDPAPFLVQLPEPQPEQEQQPSPEDQQKMAEMQMELQQKQVEMELELARHQQEMEQDEEEHLQELKQRREMHALDKANRQ